MKKVLPYVVFLVAAANCAFLYYHLVLANARAGTKMWVPNINLKRAGAELWQTLGPPLLVFIGIVVGLILLANGIAAARRRKGSVVILTTKQSYKLGETIQGALSVRMNRDFSCDRITVTLRCFVEGRDSDGHRSEKTLFESMAIVAHQRPLFRGATQTFPFELAIPSEVSAGYELDLAKLDDFGTAGKLAKSFFKMAAAGEERGRRWQLLAAAEVPGLDVTTVQPLVVDGARPAPVARPAAAR
jgi:hypothetical protein